MSLISDLFGFKDVFLSNVSLQSKAQYILSRCPDQKNNDPLFLDFAFVFGNQHLNNVFTRAVKRLIFLIAINR